MRQQCALGVPRARRLEGIGLGLELGLGLGLGLGLELGLRLELARRLEGTEAVAARLEVADGVGAPG